jgi:hypothetical protein
MKALDRLLEEVIHALGEAPLVVTADKGFAYAECARLCAELGAFGKDYANMPHRPGIGWAGLRGEVSLLVNWFRLGCAWERSPDTTASTTPRSSFAAPTTE